ncbi:MAG: hypothetical protein Q8O41_03580 [Candidatus Methanoperedens sp.]|nr:hypothetical protein [Candidatus Methanoperedens sp.]
MERLTRERLRLLSEHQGKDAGIQKPAGRDVEAQGLECIVTSRFWKV